MSDAPTEFSEPDVEETFALFRRIGFDPPAHASDGGRPGYEFAGRAEIKFAVLRPDEPFGVSSAIPAESRTFFLKLAEHRQAMQVLTDPTGTYVFEPGGKVEHIPHDQEPAPEAPPPKPWWKFW